MAATEGRAQDICLSGKPQITWALQRETGNLGVETVSNKIDSRQRRGWRFKLMAAVVAIPVIAVLVGTGIVRPLQSVIGYNDYGNAPCQWFNSGGGVTIRYDWGSNLQGPSLIRSAFQAGVGNWNAANTPVNLSENSTEQALLNSDYVPGGAAGWTDWNYCGTNRIYTFAFMNSSGFNSSAAEATAGHELGHVIGLGHSFANPALMGVNPDPTIFFKPQQDDIDGVIAIYPLFP